MEVPHTRRLVHLVVATELGGMRAIRIPNTPGYLAVEMYCEKIVPQVF